MTAQSIGTLINPVVNDLADKLGKARPMPEDRYAHWRRNLAGEPVQVHDSDPQLGFYRRRRFKGGPFLPVAIFEHEGDVVCLVDGKEAEPSQTWQFCYAHPVSEEWYRLVADQRQPWPDIDASVAASLSPPPSAGSNEPADEAEMLRDQIESAKAGAAEYEKIGDDETAKRAQSLRSRLLELSRDADKRRETLKKPHFEAGKAVDLKWQPLVKLAKEIADQIARSMGVYETAKAKAAAQETARQREEQRLRDEKAREAAEAGKPAPEPVRAPEPPAASTPATVIKGGYGRAASVRVVRIATVVDQDAAYGFLKAHPETVDLIARLAQRAVDKGHDVPGVAVEEQRKVA